MLTASVEFYAVEVLSSIAHVASALRRVVNHQGHWSYVLLQGSSVRMTDAYCLRSILRCSCYTRLDIMTTLPVSMTTTASNMKLRRAS